MRFEDWEKRLHQYLAQIGPFEWGSNDCCQFTLGNWCELCTGINHLVSYKYKTEAGALRILNRLGGLEALATKHLGEPKPSSFAKRGDIVLFNGDQGSTLGLCTGAKIAAVGPNGFSILPINHALLAWSV